MKLAPSVFLGIASALGALADPCTVFVGSNVSGAGGGISFTFNHDNPDHWSWNSDVGDAVIQDDGWAYFDGNGKTRTATMRITYDGNTALVQPPNGQNGWCTLQADGQNGINNVSGWD